MIVAFSRCAALALLAGGLAGCETLTSIDVKDGSVFVPSARLSVPLSEQREAPSEPQTGHAIELGYTQAKGTGTQSLDAGQDPIVFGGRRFNAPREIQYGFDYGHTELRYRWRKFFGASGKFGIEALGGAVYSQLKLATSSPGLDANDKLSSAGVSGGVGGIWRFRPTTSLQARLSVFAATETSGGRLELFAVQALGRNAAIRGGYTWWRLYASGEFDRSDIAIRFNGPAASLEVMF